MAILSRLLASAQPIINTTKSYGRQSMGNVFAIQKQVIRAGHDHAREMNITPSRWAYKKAKDEWQFYALLTGLPLFVFIHAVNIFIGPAELAETPEGYEPEFYEYYKHPITRWLCRHFFYDTQMDYEKAMHHLQEQHEKYLMRQLEHKINELQQIRGDYQGWWYWPSNAENIARKKIYETENYGEADGRLDHS